jgi:hypothetical protein
MGNRPRRQGDAGRVDSGERQGHPVLRGDPTATPPRAQVSLPAETNEISQASTLLKSLDTLGIPAQDEVLVTLDAAHTCRETDREIKKRKQLYYLMNVEGNRPGLQAAVFAKLAPLTLERSDDVIIERARPNQEMVVLDNRADGITFPSASWVALIRRDVFEISGHTHLPGRNGPPRTRHRAHPCHQPRANHRHEGHHGNQGMDRGPLNPSSQLHDYVERHPSPEVTSDWPWVSGWSRRSHGRPCVLSC